jgi:hypothetical protein
MRCAGIHEVLDLHAQGLFGFTKSQRPVSALRNPEVS